MAQEDTNNPSDCVVQAAMLIAAGFSVEYGKLTLDARQMIRALELARDKELSDLIVYGEGLYLTDGEL